MRRTSLIMAGTVAVVLLAVGAWWLASPADSLRPPKLIDASEVKLAAKPAIRREEAFKPPEIFGKVEIVHLEQGRVSFRVRSTLPKTPGWDSEQNADHRRLDMTCWITVPEGVIIRRLDGDLGELAVGQTVSAWCYRQWGLTYPPQGSAHFVVIEPDDW